MPVREWFLLLAALILPAIWLARRARRRLRADAFAANCFEDWFADDISTPLCLIDAEGIIVRVNAQGLKLVGSPGREIIGTSLADLLPDSLAPLFLYRIASKNRSEPLLLVNNTPSNWLNANGLILLPVRDAKKRIGGYIVRLCDVIDEESPMLTRQDLLGAADRADSAENRNNGSAAVTTA